MAIARLASDLLHLCYSSHITKMSRKDYSRISSILEMRNVVSTLNTYLVWHNTSLIIEQVYKWVGGQWEKKLGILQFLINTPSNHHIF